MREVLSKVSLLWTGGSNVSRCCEIFVSLFTSHPCSHSCLLSCTESHLAHVLPSSQPWTRRHLPFFHAFHPSEAPSSQLSHPTNSGCLGNLGSPSWLPQFKGTAAVSLGTISLHCGWESAPGRKLELTLFFLKNHSRALPPLLCLKTVVSFILFSYTFP